MHNTEEGELDIKQHVMLAHQHTLMALDIAYGKVGHEPQQYWVRRGLSQAQSILISMIVNDRLK